MNAPYFGPLALGGGPLVGDRLVRQVYVDEAGISQHEPVTFVAGVIVDADRQLVALERRILEVRNRVVPEAERSGFCFHAKDLYHGNNFFAIERWPDREERYKILEELASIPKEFSLPVFYGASKRDSFMKGSPKRPTQEAKLAPLIHANAYGVCVTITEYWMRQNTAKDEIAQIIARG